MISLENARNLMRTNHNTDKIFDKVDRLIEEAARDGEESVSISFNKGELTNSQRNALFNELRSEGYAVEVYATLSENTTTFKINWSTLADGLLLEN